MWHAHSTNEIETLSKDSKVDNLVILTVTFVLKITDLDLVATRGIHVSQTHIVFTLKLICSNSNSAICQTAKLYRFYLT